MTIMSRTSLRGQNDQTVAVEREGGFHGGNRSLTRRFDLEHDVVVQVPAVRAAHAVLRANIMLPTTYAQQNRLDVP